MGTATRGRVHEQPISRQRAWDNFEKDATEKHRGTCYGVGNDQTCKETSSWARLVKREERSLAETRRR